MKTVRALVNKAIAEALEYRTESIVAFLSASKSRKSTVGQLATDLDYTEAEIAEALLPLAGGGEVQIGIGVELVVFLTPHI